MAATAGRRRALRAVAPATRSGSRSVRTLPSHVVAPRLRRLPRRQVDRACESPAACARCAAASGRCAGPWPAALPDCRRRPGAPREAMRDHRLGSWWRRGTRQEDGPGHQHHVGEDGHDQRRLQSRGSAGAAANDVEHRRARPWPSAVVPSTRDIPGHRTVSRLALRGVQPSGPVDVEPTPRGRTDRPMLTVALALALAAAPPARTSPVAERTITADAIRAHVRFLASDLLEGRGPGTRGDALAQAYIASRARGARARARGHPGLLPAVRHRRHRRPRREPASSPAAGTSLGAPPPGRLHRRRRGCRQRTTALDRRRAGLRRLRHPSPPSTLGRLQGHGPPAARSLLMMNNDPEDDPALFAGTDAALVRPLGLQVRDGREGRRRRRHHHPHHAVSAGYPWQVVQTSWTGEQFDLPATDGEPRAPGEGLDHRGRHAAGSRRSPARTSTRCGPPRRTRDFQPVPLGVTVTHARSRTRSSAADRERAGPAARQRPELAQEVVLYTAHHDHLGHKAEARSRARTPSTTARADNASGVAAMLAVARALPRAAEGAEAQHPLRRGGRRGAGPARLASTSREHPPVPARAHRREHQHRRRQHLGPHARRHRHRPGQVRPRRHDPRRSPRRRAACREGGPAPRPRLLLPLATSSTSPSGACPRPTSSSGHRLHRQARRAGASSSARHWEETALPPALRRADRPTGTSRARSRTRSSTSALGARVANAAADAGLEQGRRVRGRAPAVPRGAPRSVRREPRRPAAVA